MRYFVMPLIFTVLSRKGRPTTETNAISFGRKGGTIGRSLTNDLVLPDPDRFISRQHAVVHYENGCYHLKDNSLSGTDILNKKLHLHDDSARLDDGDKLGIGEYEIEVRLQKDDTSESVQTPFLIHDKSTSLIDIDNESDEDFIHTDEDDPLWRDRDYVDRTSDDTSSHNHSDSSPICDSFVPPDVKPAENQRVEIPDDFDFKNLLNSSWEDIDDTEEPPNVIRAPDEKETNEASDEKMSSDLAERNENAPVRAERTEREINEQQSWIDPEQKSQQPEEYQRELFDLFLGAAGISDRNFFREDEIPEVIKTAGVLLRELIEGLVRILRARAEFKSQIRVTGTLLRESDNNPLKFSPDIEEVIKILLGKKKGGFADARNAVRESYADIMSHQLAMTAGIQAALESLVKRFDPRRYAERFEEGIVFQRKAKCWDAYSNDYPRIVDDVLDKILGEEFAEAYEEQIIKLCKKHNAR